MVKGHILAAAALALGVAATAAGAPHARKAAPSVQAPSARTQQLLQNCDAHKFETVVQEIVDGQPHQSKVKLCGKEGQSNAEWIATLEDAVTKLNANVQMPRAVRDQIITALNREILRLDGGEKLAHAQPINDVPISNLTTINAKRQPSQPEAGIAQGFSPLPPFPPSQQSDGSALPPPRQTAPSAPASEYAALPPLPTAPPPQTHVLAGAGASIALLPMPRMKFSCYTPGEGIDGPCTGFTRDTLLTVRADEDLPAGTSLRFVRDGDPRIDVALAQLKRGRSMQLGLPADVCSHAIGGKLELRIVRAGQEVGSDGPYNLNC